MRGRKRDWQHVQVLALDSTLAGIACGGEDDKVGGTDPRDPSGPNRDHLHLVLVLSLALTACAAPAPDSMETKAVCETRCEKGDAASCPELEEGFWAEPWLVDVDDDEVSLSWLLPDERPCAKNPSEAAVQIMDLTTGSEERRTIDDLRCAEVRDVGGEQMGRVVTARVVELNPDTDYAITASEVALEAQFSCSTSTAYVRTAQAPGEGSPRFILVGDSQGKKAYGSRFDACSLREYRQGNHSQKLGRTAYLHLDTLKQALDHRAGGGLDSLREYYDFGLHLGDVGELVESDLTDPFRLTHPIECRYHAELLANSDSLFRLLPILAVAGNHDFVPWDQGPDQPPLWRGLDEFLRYFGAKPTYHSDDRGIRELGFVVKRGRMTIIFANEQALEHPDRSPNTTPDDVLQWLREAFAEAQRERLLRPFIFLAGHHFVGTSRYQYPISESLARYRAEALSLVENEGLDGVFSGHAHLVEIGGLGSQDRIDSTPDDWEAIHVISGTIGAYDHLFEADTFYWRSEDEGCRFCRAPRADGTEEVVYRARAFAARDKSGVDGVEQPRAGGNYFIEGSLSPEQDRLELQTFAYNPGGALDPVPREVPGVAAVHYARVPHRIVERPLAAGESHYYGPYVIGKAGMAANLQIDLDVGQGDVEVRTLTPEGTSTGDCDVTGSGSCVMSTDGDAERLMVVVSAAGSRARYSLFVGPAED